MKFVIPTALILIAFLFFTGASSLLRQACYTWTCDPLIVLCLIGLALAVLAAAAWADRKN